MVIDRHAIQALCLVLARIMPISLFSPALGAKIFNTKCRVGIALVLALAISSAIKPMDISDFGAAIVLQLIVGFVLALFSAIPFYAIQSIGEWIDLHRGETFSSILIPQMLTKTSSLGRVYLLLSITLFFACDGHLRLISEIISSFTVIPLHQSGWEKWGNLQGLPGLIEWNRQMANLFFIALKFALPVVFCLWITDILLGILNRTAPSLQVFFIGLPLKMWVGIAVTGIALGCSVEPMIKYILLSIRLLA